MTHDDLTELQIEISELEKENQDLRDRVKELEVNLSYLTSKVEANTNTDTQSTPSVSGTVVTNDSVH